MLKILVTGGGGLLALHGFKSENGDLIGNRESEFQKRGGKFIIPIPEPRIMDSLTQVSIR